MAETTTDKAIKVMQDALNKAGFELIDCPVFDGMGEPATGFTLIVKEEDGTEVYTDILLSPGEEVPPLTEEAKAERG